MSGATRQEAPVIGSAAELRCPTCGEPALPGESFCESCGADLSAPPGGTAQTGQPLRPAAPPAAAEPAGSNGSAQRPDVQPADVPRGLRDAVPAGLRGTAADPALDQPPLDQPADAVDPMAELRMGRATSCAACAGRIAADGYCEVCGAPAVRERDHWLEQPSSWVAGVCDRGMRHPRNEDAMALAATPEPDGRAVLVVCDGVSSSASSDLASLAAARAARGVLLDTAPTGPSVAVRASVWTDRLTAAAAAANAAIVEVTRQLRRPETASGSVGSSVAGGRQIDRDVISNPPSATFVAAAVDGSVLVAGWVGDSRAYWLPDSGEPEQLSTDDSWASEQIALGLPRAQAESAAQAHAITRWLGVDSPGYEPRVASLVCQQPGWLLICSDGLWNYCSVPGDVGRLVSATVDGVSGDPGRAAAELVAWANQQGGHDNVTVALARLTGEDHAQERAPRSVEEPVKQSADPRPEQAAGPRLDQPAGDPPTAARA